MASRALNTIVTVSLTGQSEYTVPFEYLARKFVKLTLIGIDRRPLVLNVDYRFVNKTTISLFTPAVAGYTKLELRRETSATERLVTFIDGSILKADALNISQVQALHIAEEGRDYTNLLLNVNDDGNFDARGQRIINMANGVAPQDAVTFSQLQEVIAYNDDPTPFIWNRNVIALAVGTTYGKYSQDGRRLTPRLSYGQNQYLPIVDTTDAFQFLGAPQVNADGTITVETTIGPRTFSKARAEALSADVMDYIDIRHYGADVSYNAATNTAAIQKAFDAAPEGANVAFIGAGEYRFEEIVITKRVTLVGAADLRFQCFRIKASNVTSMLTGNLTATTYGSIYRAFYVSAYEDGVDYENIRILYANFYDWFYCTDFRGRPYASVDGDPLIKVMKNTLVMGCTSVVPQDGKNRGHFQHTGVTNCRVIGCATYGGKNATSYNFINGNGYIIVQGCYDENNSYGSLEIENNRLSMGSVTGNSFGHDLWIDDTSNITVTGNSVKRTIRLTAQSNDLTDITVVGNVCGNISVTRFGEDPQGLIHRILIANNTLLGGVGGSHAIFCDSSVQSATIMGNNIGADFTNSMALVRSANCQYIVKHNVGSKPIIASSTGGTMIVYGNEGINYTGANNVARHIDTLLKPSEDYLDLPGKYLHGTKYAGQLGAGQTATVVLPIPDSGTLSFRGVALWVMIRDVGTNNTSCFRADGIHKVVGPAIGFSMGTPYSVFGVDGAAVNLANNGSTLTEIRIQFRNAGSKNLQVTVMPEVSSRFGTEA